MFLLGKQVVKMSIKLFLYKNSQTLSQKYSLISDTYIYIVQLGSCFQELVEKKMAIKKNIVEG